MLTDALITWYLALVISRLKFYKSCLAFHQAYQAPRRFSNMEFKCSFCGYPAALIQF